MKSRKSTITLDDLLRLKRAEQPPAEFWNQFERELRAKQLAAIVEPRPWWAPLIRVGAKFSYLQMPVGAAAILVVTLVSIQQQSVTPANIPSLKIATHQSASTPAQQVLDEPPLLAVNDSEAINDLPESTGQLAMNVDRPYVSPVSDESLDDSRSTEAVENALEPTPSARYIAANLAAAQEADPSLLDEVFGNSYRHAQSRQPIRDPLAKVSSLGETRRSRLLATALPVSASANEVVGTNERIARRLTEQRLHDTISRVGLKGDRVAIKF